MRFFFLDEQTQINGDFFLWRSAVFAAFRGSTANYLKCEIDNADVIIDEDCLISDEILIQANDQHGIIDLANGRIINNIRRRNIIGKHSWIGRRANILPNVNVGEGGIIGACSVVTKNTQPFCSFGGNPARLIKENVSWARENSTISEQETQYFQQNNFSFG